MSWAQSVLAMVGCALTYAFMVGQYLVGAQLFTAPLAAEVDPELIVTTPTQRSRRLAAGATWCWCTLAALQGTAVADMAVRAVVAMEGLQGPTTTLASAVSPTPGVSSKFLFGAKPPAELVHRPVLKPSEGPFAKAWDPSLEGWAERISLSLIHI